MADSYRLQALKALTAVLEATSLTPIPSLAPYTMPATLAGLVFRGRSRFGDSDPVTMLSILEGSRPGGALYAGDEEARSELWPLLIQGWCPEDVHHPSDPIYSFVDDVERQLDRIIRVSTDTGVPSFPEYMLGVNAEGQTLISRLEISPPVVRPPTENISSRCFFYIPLQVGLARISS